jgi:hypothetical protein
VAACNHLAEVYGVADALQALEVGLGGLCRSDKPSVEGISVILGCLSTVLKKHADGIAEVVRV